MPMSTSIFDNVQGKKIKVYHSDGSEFKIPKEIDNLFVVSHIISVYDEKTEKDSTQKVFSDIVPEDIVGLRIGENWAINAKTLEIMKKVAYFLPLYRYDEDTYTQLGVRIYNNPKKN